MSKVDAWQFTGNDATFSLKNPDLNSYLYFPLANEAGMMSCITPTLSGDIKTGQNSFLMTPVSAEDLHLSRSSRNFWIYKEGMGAYSAAGVSAKQIANRDSGAESSTLEAGLLWHKITRENAEFGIRSEITSFVPCESDTVELSKIVITNISQQEADITPTFAVPVYGRSADNIRSHRHVTSLLQRTEAEKYGVTVKPTMLFDERGHSVNRNTYSVLGAQGNGQPPAGFFTDVEDFIGEGGTLDWPKAVVENLPPKAVVGYRSEGYEAIGALRFKKVTLAPGQKAVFIVALCVNGRNIAEKYLSEEKFDRYLQQTKAFWQKKLNINFHTSDRELDLWLKWVSCEPVLRRIYGCSFLPHHDYGRGGRGWRDLWQDCIALLLMEPEKVSEMLFQNCAGIRFDGTNATIIGAGKGEFIADRDNITRVWMDHAAWPLNTVELYINESGDLDFLLREQTYFKDRLIMRGKAADTEWGEEYGTKLQCENKRPYLGTVIEHLLIENMTACLNVGRHGMLRLENADWNDALDMAAQNGESVAFSSMYCGNLKALSALLRRLKGDKKVTHLELAKEMQILFDGFKKAETPVQKQQFLKDFCNTCRHDISGVKRRFAVDEIIETLDGMAQRLAVLIVENEKVSSTEGYTWLNGYYDNDSERVEGEKNGVVRMTLTGQVFPIMFSVSDDKLTAEMVRAADRYLFDGSTGGYRLNTNFNELKMNLGRQFGFAYGHKENGAVFSHMTIMFANALYRRGFAHEGYKALETLWHHCMDFEKSRIYPGIPEYINQRGRGMYHYLTGAASWLMLTLVTEAFGIRGEWGNLVVSPKLLAQQFDKNGNCACERIFAGRKFKVVYHNPARLDYGSYAISNATLDGMQKEIKNGRLELTQEELHALSRDKLHIVEILLKEKNSDD
ncbi:cellobiose phosphorylase-like protein [[Clostridium] cellulosi]|uniref:Cellobiose phosphorylase-like protein n=1 Tax=[Clostridium] cellulosi TaxID=29343 RepID=A0A078KN66_9FIRM|nr:cellobiose phosphorylase-like protein [[Clostridium] cellulosi]